MKRILLSAIIAMGIHAYLLWADFGWIGKKPSLKPKPQMVTLTLMSRPMPEVEPATKLSKPASPSVSKPAPKITKPLSPPAPEPKPKPAPESEPEPKSKPEPGRERVSEVKATPPPPETQKPSRFISEGKPVLYSKPELTTGKEKPDAPAVVTGPAPQPRKVLKTADQEQPGSAGPAEASPSPVFSREAKPRYRNNPPPLYPILAQKRNYQGTVILDVFIDKNGRVADMKVFSSSGYSILDKAARSTVENWLFDPGMKGEEKIDMWVKIPIRFQIK